MGQLLRHLAGHLKPKKKTSAEEYGVPGMRGHGHPGGAGKVSKPPKQQRVGFHKAPKIAARPGGKHDAMNRYGVISKNVHASAQPLFGDRRFRILEGLPADADFRKKHGVPPSGKGPHPASSYKLPLPPATHPMAKRYARAVLSRAHKTKGVSPENVAKQIRKANTILYGKPNPTSADKAKHRESAPVRLLEYIPEKPAGSWERVSQKITDAARQCDLFGGPVDDQAPYSDNALRSWDINVWASFPQKKAVIISNEKSGKLYFANYGGDKDDVEFSNVKEVVLSVKAAKEAARRRHAIDTVVECLKESGAPAKLITVRSGVVVFGKIVEGIHISGSAEEAVNKVAPRVSAIRKHVKSLSRAVASGPCPCGDAAHRPKLIASFPESKTLVTDCEAGLHSVPYGVKGGALQYGQATRVKAKLVPVKSAKEARADRGRGRPGNLRESGTNTAPTTASLHLFARIREAKVDDKGAHATCVMLEEGPGNEADGHYYPADSIKQCVEAGIFEGSQTFADHPSSLEDRVRPERSIRDLIGWWSDVHVEEADGKVAMVGTYNIETGNEFALNKMREAAIYLKKYPDKPGYVGFSINAAGVSEPQEIEGKTYNVVTKIAEAVSTDMVTRAGARGRLLNLKEVDTVATALNLDKKARRVIESIVGAAVKKVREADGDETMERAKAVEEALTAAGVKLDDDQVKSLHKALGVKPKSADPPEEDEEEDDMGIEGLGGDDELDEQPEDVEDPEDPDDDEQSVEGKREAAKRRDAIVAENTKLKETVSKLQAKEAVREARRVADKLVEEFKVPAAARSYVVSELLEVEGGEKKMREKIKAMVEFIGSVGSGVDGVPAREAASGSGGGAGLITI
jgi:hypothetical protein